MVGKYGISAASGAVACFKVLCSPARRRLRTSPTKNDNVPAIIEYKERVSNDRKHGVILAFCINVACGLQSSVRGSNPAYQTGREPVDPSSLDARLFVRSSSRSAKLTQSMTQYRNDNTIITTAQGIETTVEEFVKDFYGGEFKYENRW